MTPRTVLIVCAKAPRRMQPVPAVKHGGARWRVTNGRNRVWWEPEVWLCSFCGARVKVVA